jgi:hypothetical protein
VLAPAAYGLTGVRGEAVAERNGHVSRLEDLREITLHAAGLGRGELLCGRENGGSLTVSMEKPWDIRLVAPDGTAHPMQVRRGVDRWYASITGMPPGDYLLAILPPPESPPNRLPA